MRSASPVAAVTGTGVTCGRTRASSAGSGLHKRPCHVADTGMRKPVTHRASYWKTTLVLLTGAVLTLVALALLPTSTLPPVQVAFVCFPFAAIAAAFLLVTTGGMVCLWRDARETSAKPDAFACYANAIPGGWPPDSIRVQILAWYQAATWGHRSSKDASRDQRNARRHGCARWVAAYDLPGFFGPPIS